MPRKTTARKKPAKRKVAAKSKKKTIRRAAKKPTKKVARKKIAKKITKKTPKTTAKNTPRKKKTSKDVHTIALINEKLSQLEGQAMKAYECVQAIRKRSTPDWKEWVDKLSPQDWTALAGAQQKRVKEEIRHLSDEILSKIYDADILQDKDSILKDAKYSLEDIVDRVDRCNLVEKAIDTAIHTKDGLLAFLNIPTHDEMVKLQRKLSRIERRMSDLPARSRR